jgi:hypothetical protein
MWAEKKICGGNFLTLFFLRSQFIPGGHKIFGMAGSTVDLPPLNLRPTHDYDLVGHNGQLVYKALYREAKLCK